MVRKFFPLDKNYLLEEAQLCLQNALLLVLMDKVKEHYFLRYNPLRLADSVSQDVENFKPDDLSALNTFYQNLAAVYRYKFGENQLEFLWDGNDHNKKYQAEWTDFFNQRTSRFCRQELFLKAVLDVTVFLSEKQDVQLVANKMNHFILREFDVRLDKQRGILAMKVA